MYTRSAEMENERVENEIGCTSSMRTPDLSDTDRVREIDGQQNMRAQWTTKLYPRSGVCKIHNKN